ncbi:hypothetical protein WR25_05645 [Diploscapter pachys]|uniref:Lipid-binding serum glycoprotein C-terminal domain-containing protein n=1 Tax=Diploscapter pachys TaxID=2018661 RepID=A0A2A2KRJ0_9BILA|nr:hypothetical protein WR25_05645 [Diploscapter pachys]
MFHSIQCVLVESKEDTSVGPIFDVDLLNRIIYKNLSMRFEHDSIHLQVERLSAVSRANLTNVFWPLGLSDQVVDFSVELPEGELKFDVSENSLRVADCSLRDAAVDIDIKERWLANAGASLMIQMMNPIMEKALCSSIKRKIGTIEHNREMKFPVYDIAPVKVQKYLAEKNTTLYYKIRSIESDEHQLKLRAQLQWTDIHSNDEGEKLLNNANLTVFDLELKGDDRIQIWLEDKILNELFEQFSWEFEWLKEDIPVTSPMIPLDSREFLSTLCADCFFKVNVNAHGRPTIVATNDSFVLNKTDRIHLQVINPIKNVSTVFVALVLTIQAELRPTFDNGALRTLVQLLDTNIEMQKGAFPKNWALFMGDLIRGMILDMIWPELKNTIEEFTYAKGVRINRACGIDPNQIQLEIEECFKDIKNSIPDPEKLLEKVEFAHANDTSFDLPRH